MYEDFAPKLAGVITEYSQPIQHGDFVMIQSSSHSIPLAQALYEQVLRRGGHPYIIAGVPGLEQLFYRLADEHQLTFANPIFKTLAQTIDVNFNIYAKSNTKAMSNVDPEKQRLHEESEREAAEIYMKRVAEGSLRWCIMLYPTEADAQQAEMSLLDWTQFIYEACALHLDDPVAYWHQKRDQQLHLTNYLNDRSEVAVKGAGIDLSFNYKGRCWVSAHGNRNFPDGEIFTGPVESSVNGYIDFNLPSIVEGHHVDSIHLEFKDGVVVEAYAEKGNDYLQSFLKTDDGAQRMGEFAIGTNAFVNKITGNTLFDEKLGGTIHMALGRSIPDTLGENESRVHWDLVHDMKAGGEIWIDGELCYHAGEFQL